jgi:hypothetical protein
VSVYDVAFPTFIEVLRTVQEKSPDSVREDQKATPLAEKGGRSFSRCNFGAQEESKQTKKNE